MSIVPKARAVSTILVLALLIFCIAPPANAQITRLSETASYVGGLPFFTDNFPANGGGGGSLFYSNRVTVPANANTLLIDLSGTTTFECAFDTEDSENFVLFSCLMDGNLCVPQGAANLDGAELGWITLNALTGFATLCDPLFNTIHMTWCIPPGRYTSGGPTHTINLKIASGQGNDVFLQQAKVTIDAVQVSDASNACTSKGFFLPPGF